MNVGLVGLRMFLLIDGSPEHRRPLYRGPGNAWQVGGPAHAKGDRTRATVMHGTFSVTLSKMDRVKPRSQIKVDDYTTWTIDSSAHLTTGKG